jgi:hypothetical protein
MTRPWLLERLEAACFVAGLIALLWTFGAPWPWLVAGLVLPDLSLAGYLRGPVTGARVYNAVHAWVGPSVLLALALSTGGGFGGPLVTLALAWGLHVAVDRVLGYGLKLPSGFNDTHLGRIGR